MLIISGVINAQFKLRSVNISVGVGSIQSASPNLTTFDFQSGIEFSTNQKLNYKINYFYSRKVEYFLPENRSNKYYPFVSGLSALVGLTQMNGKFIFDEGLGATYVNNGIFNSGSNYSMGLAFSFSARLILHQSRKKGWEIGIFTGMVQTFGAEALRRVNINVGVSYILSLPIL